ncbi:MAG TPA: aminotransferase class I/II-fold pyridoxal phosphate-dependent enzyme [Actinomycetota bacterium]
MSAHRVSRKIEHVRESQAPLLRFFDQSAWAHRNVSDPDNADFVAGNPQEMVLPGFVEALQRWVVPQDKDWYAYKFNEPEARAAAAGGLRELRGVPFRDEDVFLTDGAFAGLNITIGAVSDPGDEVVFISPPWFFYEAIIVAAGATPVRVHVHPPAFDLDLDEIAGAISERTRAIVVNSPNNPTGRVYPPEQLEALAGVLTEASERNGRPIYLVSDEAYWRIVYDDREYRSPTEFYPYSFLVYTYGKTLLTPGQRLGYVALPPQMPHREELHEAMLIAQLAIGGHAVPNALLQHALADLERLSIDVKALQRRRDRMVDALRSFGYDLRSPEGTFYLLPRCPVEDDEAFTERLAAEKVYVLPGTIVEMPGSFRISLTATDEMVERALPVFERAFRA